MSSPQSGHGRLGEDQVGHDPQADPNSADALIYNQCQQDLRNIVDHFAFHFHLGVVDPSKPVHDRAKDHRQRHHAGSGSRPKPPTVKVAVYYHNHYDSFATEDSGILDKHSIKAAVGGARLLPKPVSELQKRSARRPRQVEVRKFVKFDNSVNDFPDKAIAQLFVTCPRLAHELYDMCQGKTWVDIPLPIKSTSFLHFNPKTHLLIIGPDLAFHTLSPTSPHFLSAAFPMIKDAENIAIEFPAEKCHDVSLIDPTIDEGLYAYVAVHFPKAKFFGIIDSSIRVATGGEIKPDPRRKMFYNGESTYVQVMYEGEEPFVTRPRLRDLILEGNNSESKSLVWLFKKKLFSALVKPSRAYKMLKHQGRSTMEASLTKKIDRMSARHDMAAAEADLLYLRSLNRAKSRFLRVTVLAKLGRDH